MEEEETVEDYAQFIAHGQDAFADAREALIDVFDEIGTLTGGVILLARMVYRISNATDSDATIDDIGSFVSSVARTIGQLADPPDSDEPEERKALPSDFLDGRQFHVEIEQFHNARHPALLEFEWALDSLDVRGALYCAGVMCWSTARGTQVTIDSLVKVVCAYATQLREYDESPEGQAELAEDNVSIASESYIKTADACFGLAGSAIDHGPQGFLAFRDASPYLRSPSGWGVQKYVAEADFDGAHGPIRARVSAAFTSAGKCKRTNVSFRGNERDLTQVRADKCDGLARRHGSPTYAKGDIVEWNMRFPDGEARYTVELSHEFNEAVLSVSVGVKAFW